MSLDFIAHFTFPAKILPANRRNKQQPCNNQQPPTTPGSTRNPQQPTTLNLNLPGHSSLAKQQATAIESQTNNPTKPLCPSSQQPQRIQLNKSSRIQAPSPKLWKATRVVQLVRARDFLASRTDLRVFNNRSTRFKMASLFLTTLGTVLILHSTYSCLQYRSLAIAADLPDTSSPPLDVVVEVFLGFAFCLIGQLMCGAFHEVRKSGTSVGRGEIVAPAYRTRDFDLFATRARMLAGVRM
jgi:hypothetical protein